MKIGLVGYQGSGKSSLFQYLTGVEPDLSLSHTTQLATAPIPDERIDALCKIYSPKKVTQAAIEVVDTPGLSRTHEGSAGKLALIREAGCLVVVVGAFLGASPQEDVESFDEDLLLADLEIVSNRVERLRDSVKRPRPNRDKEMAELAALEPIVAALESGRALRELDLSPDQKRAIKSFQLLTEKPRMTVINVADDQANIDELVASVKSNHPVIALSVSLQLELQSMSEEERQEFCTEMQVEIFDRGRLLRAVMDASGQMIFFTAGEKEVRTWLMRKGGTAEEAAGSIHTDLARGFIRAETMTVDDLVRLGSEREVKAQNLMRKELKDYVVQDGDILHILSNA